MRDSDSAQLLQHLCSQVQSFISDTTVTGCCWVAFSGGVDSTVLLHLAQASGFWDGDQLRAVYIDHQLQTESSNWADHCRRFCGTLGVPLEVRKVAVEPTAEGLENAAREARYAVFVELLQPGDTLLMAHHQNDQAETILMRLLRGAGPRGLAGIPAERPIGNGRLLRPLLSVPRSTLVGYAQQHQLSWIEDPSNQSNDFDRNYLRNEVMPLLKARWPGFADSFEQSGQYCAAADRLTADFAAQQLAGLLQQTPWGERLLLDGLMSYPQHQQINLIRGWLRAYVHYLPDAATIQGWLQQWHDAAEEASPLFAWQGLLLRRYRGGVFIDQPGLSAMENCQVTIGESRALAVGHLAWQPAGAAGQGIRMAAGQRLQLQFAKPAGKYYLAGRQGGRTLKKIFQEYGVPPWFRERIPLLLIDGQPAALLGLASGRLVLDGFRPTSEETGFLPVWTATTVKKARRS